jgi:mannosyltransferase
MVHATYDLQVTAAGAIDSSATRRPANVATRRWDLASVAFVAIVVADVVVGTYFRFFTTSKMWLDEVQTVNIASFPVRLIPHELRLDGAPPLYYVLLHFWMGFAGHTDAAIRALSGIFSLLTLPLAWWVVRRGFGRTEALAAVAVIATSPFAAYFAVEARMYSLVMLLVVAGIGATQALLSRATVSRALLLALVTALLLYTHYWAFYLLAVVGCWFAFLVVRDRGGRRRGACYGIAALVVGALTFIPWVPTFEWQRVHTGTPWSAAPTLASAVSWFAGFVVNQSVQSPSLSLHIELGLALFVLFVIFGFATRPIAADRLEFRLTGQPRARALAFVALGTLAVGWIASREAKTAFEPRYSSIVFPVLAILVALGIAAVPTKWLRVASLCAVSGLALWTTHWGAQVQRTQAFRLAPVLHAVASPGALVVVCPDQLGPTLLRYSGRSTYDYVGFPRFTSPWIVDWIDYQRAESKVSLAQFAAHVDHLAGSSTFYVVWSPGYGFHHVCSDFVKVLTATSGRTPTVLVTAEKYKFYQSMNLLQFAPTS